MTTRRQQTIERLNEAVATFNQAISDELDKAKITGDLDTMIENSPADISARYWLMQFLEPLSRKEMKSFIDGFLVQLLNEQQAKKLVKFLMIRFPQYYTEDVTKTVDPDFDEEKTEKIQKTMEEGEKLDIEVEVEPEDKPSEESKEPAPKVEVNKNVTVKKTAPDAEDE